MSSPSRLQVDQHAPAVLRRVDAVDPDERREPVHRRILEHHAGHARCASTIASNDTAGGASRPRDGAGVLRRKKALGDDDVKGRARRERRQRDDERQGLVFEHAPGGSPVRIESVLKPALVPATRSSASGRVTGWRRRAHIMGVNVRDTTAGKESRCPG